MNQAGLGSGDQHGGLRGIPLNGVPAVLAQLHPGIIAENTGKQALTQRRVQRRIDGLTV